MKARLPILIILGPTGSGKTALAKYLSTIIPAKLISADSRQIYRRTNIVPGKDHGEVELFGIDLIEPSESGSVSHWLSHVLPILQSLVGKDSIPIVVGGTGFYLRALLSPIETISVKPNDKLRKSLENKNVEELGQILKNLSSVKFDKLSSSDQRNARRLVRAIEVAQAQDKYRTQPTMLTNPYIIGLRFDDPKIHKSQIKERVKERLLQGALSEYLSLAKKYDLTSQSISALGYRYLAKYAKGELSENELIDEWSKEEYKYAKRQMTWFRKMSSVNWFEATSPTLKDDVATAVLKWYDNTSL